MSSVHGRAHGRFTTKRTRLAIAALGAVGAASLLGSASASAADLTVNDDLTGAGPVGATCGAPDHTTIQPAINAAAAGDRILICEGTYVEQPNVDKSLSVIGAGAGSIITAPPCTLNPRPEPCGNLITRYTLSGFSVIPVVHAGADDITVRDLTIDGDQQDFENGNWLFTGVSGINVDGLEVRDNTIVNILRNPFDGVQTGYGVRLDNTDNASRSVVIDGNAISNYQKGGIVVRGIGLDGTVTDNVITGRGAQPDIAQNGISFGLGMSGTVSGNTVTQNKCNQATCGPDLTSNSQGTGLTMSTLATPGADVTITGNDFSQNDTGIFSRVRDGSLRTITNNTLVDNRYSGLFVDWGRIEAAGNTISGGNVGVGAASFAGGFLPEVHLFGNTITGAGTGVWLYQSPALPPAPVVTADHNRIVGNAVGFDNGSNASIDAQNNWWGCNEGPAHLDCDSVVGSVDFDPWLILDIAAVPTNLTVGQTSQVTAALLRNSDGLGAGTGFPDDTAIDFATDLGSVTPASALTGAGEATTALSSGSPGIATVQASLDNETVATTPGITFADPTLTVTKRGAGSGTVTSSPVGIDCGATCSHQYAYGTEVELSATADPGSVFAGFSGSNCQYQQTCTVSMHRARNIEATFRPAHTLAVTKTGGGSGTVSSSPAGIDCGPTCSQPFANGTVVELSATADPGSTFAGFSGSECQDQQTCTVTMGRARTVEATFRPAEYTLTVTKRGAGSGKVSSSPAGIDCGPTCSHEYGSGTLVELSATADPDSVFAGFSGSDCQYQQTCTVSMHRARTVEAKFTPKPGQTLTVSKRGAGTGTVSSSPAGIECGPTCSHQYAYGTEVELSATADPGFTFAGFTGAECHRQQTCAVVMSRARGVEATFRQNYTLTVAKVGSGSGTVSSSPAGIECGPSCSHDYAEGTQVELTATTETGSTFAGFSGADCQNQLTCTVAMSRVRNVDATFFSEP